MISYWINGTYYREASSCGRSHDAKRDKSTCQETWDSLGGDFESCIENSSWADDPGAYCGYLEQCKLGKRAASVRKAAVMRIAAVVRIVWDDDRAGWVYTRRDVDAGTHLLSRDHRMTNDELLGLVNDVLMADLTMGDVEIYGLNGLRAASVRVGEAKYQIYWSDAAGRDGAWLIRRGDDKPRILSEERRVTEDMLFDMAAEVDSLYTRPAPVPHRVDEEDELRFDRREFGPAQYRDRPEPLREEDVDILGFDSDAGRPDVLIYVDHVAREGRGLPVWLVKFGEQDPIPIANVFGAEKRYPGLAETPQDLVDLVNDAFSLDLTLDDVEIRDEKKRRVARR